MRIDKILGLIDLRVILQIDHTKWQPTWSDYRRIWPIDMEIYERTDGMPLIDPVVDQLMRNLEQREYERRWNDLARINEMLRVGTININIPIDANIRVDVGLTR